MTELLLCAGGAAPDPRFHPANPRSRGPRAERSGDGGRDWREWTSRAGRPSVLVACSGAGLITIGTASRKIAAHPSPLRAVALFEQLYVPTEVPQRRTVATWA